MIDFAKATASAAFFPLAAADVIRLIWCERRRRAAQVKAKASGDTRS
jgi:hypothetical protein